jgi:uncharacterized protein
MKKTFTARIVSLPETYEAAYRVARKIMDAGDKFDVAVGISRGGFPPSRMICDFLNIKTLTSLQIRHYESGGQAREEVSISDPVKIDIRGKNVLIVDDVNDSGKSLIAAYDNIKSLGPALIRTAVLHEKSGTSFTADYTGYTLSEWKWLIYQWAVTEDLIEYLERDHMLKASEEDAIAHLSEKFTLSIDRDLFSKVLSMKENYLKS